MPLNLLKYTETYCNKVQFAITYRLEHLPSHTDMYLYTVSSICHHLLILHTVYIHAVDVHCSASTCNHIANKVQLGYDRV